MLDQMLPKLSPRALAAVAQLRGANFPGPAVELVVAHCIMHVAELDLDDVARGSRKLKRLSRSPVLGPAANAALRPAASSPGEAASQFRSSKAGGTARAMLGLGQDEPSAPAPAGAAAETPWLTYGLGLGALGLIGYFGYDWWRKQQQKQKRAR